MTKATKSTKTTSAPAAEPMTAEEVFALMPKTARTFEQLMQEFVDTIPPGTPEAAIAMARRVFIGGAAAVLDQLHTQITLANETGDGTGALNTLNGLGVGVQVAMDHETQLLAAEIEAAKAGRVIRIHPGH